ncbi:MAG: hypothetical protein JWM78_1389 [Verrucomicrobiaceae bacterium]|nr:hypothetical protein [Verrucomicrobiaceae bacterium]
MLRRWFKRSSSITSALPETEAAAPTDDMRAVREIYLNLFDVQRSHALIDVAIDGVDAHYQSIILDVDPQRGAITIDELFPAGFVGIPGQPVTVTVRLDGARRLTFNTHITARRDDDNSIDSYALALPATLDYNQRRGAFRLQLGQSWAVVSEFRAPDQQQCSARVRDLSSTGIRLELQKPLPLNEGDVLEDLQFEFAGRNYRCIADVRSVMNHDRGDRFVIGAAFRDLPKQEQRSLERMIMQMQRQHVQQVAL